MNLSGVGADGGAACGRARYAQQSAVCEAGGVRRRLESPSFAVPGLDEIRRCVIGGVLTDSGARLGGVARHAIQRDLTGAQGEIPPGSASAERARSCRSTAPPASGPRGERSRCRLPCTPSLRCRTLHRTAPRVLGAAMARPGPASCCRSTTWQAVEPFPWRCSSRLRCRCALAGTTLRRASCLWRAEVSPVCARPCRPTSRRWRVVARPRCGRRPRMR